MEEKNQVISSIIINKKIYLESIIFDELNYLNFDLQHLGTNFIKDCIYKAYISQNRYINFKKEVFPYIINEYHTNYSNIKFNIYYAINYSYYESSEELLSEYFNKKFTSKPVLKDIVYGVVDHINKKAEGNP